MKPIPGFPKYKITKDGRIWSLYRGGRWLSLTENMHGRLRVSLYKNGEQHHKEVHRLVLETFVGPCPDGMQSCHNNGNKTDNLINNLRWDTSSNNHKDTVKHGTSPFGNGESNIRSKLKERDVINIIHLYNTKLFSQQEVANMYKISQTMVSHILNRRRWKHYLGE